VIRSSVRLRLDLGAVEKEADKAKYRALAKYGGYGRRVMRTSLKKRKGRTSRGQTPANRTGAIKSFIFFGVDRQSESVVIGPEVLPKGGKGLRWLEDDFPFVGPAKEVTDKKLPEFWGNSIRG